MASVEQEKVQNQLELISAKLIEIENSGKYQPVVAFRGTGVKDSGSSSTQSVSKHGEF